ncbi:MAG TPA: branched-chain amino acid ABC transporter permease [Mycobacteriales bacterium]|nr:branched-chain amino acid ABC transporter permease [Mycobacteriales bacterium]
MDRFIALLLSGVAYGAILALVALGFIVLYRATGVVNFAHGDLVTLGTYIAIWSIDSLKLPTVVGYAFAIVAMFGVGVVIERVAYAPLRARPPLVVVIATLAAAVVIEGVLAVWQGSSPKLLSSPVGNRVWSIDGADIAVQRVLIIGVAAVVIIGLMLVFARTSIGRQLRAIATDPETAQLYGVRTRLMSVLAFGTSAALATLAGILVAPLSAADLTFGFDLMVSAFAAAVLGGFGSFGGVALGALAVGLIQQLLGGYVFTGYSETLPFVVMFIVIAVRPSGLVSTTASRL